MAQLTKIWPLFVAGTLLGGLAYLFGLPMPFMLGGMTGAGFAVFMIESRSGPQDLRMPPRLRENVIASIGIMIGAGFTPQLAGLLPQFWPSVIAVLGFIALAHSGGYWIMRLWGGYRPVDALFASMPGGLIEASLLGERLGADARLLAIQHFIRVMLVVYSVPLLVLIATGQVVGSASGQTFGSGAYSSMDLIWILVLAPIGLYLGKLVRISAPHLMGPLIFCGLLHVLGIVQITPPGWLMHLAQLVIGVSLGAQFSGLTKSVLIRGLSTGILAVAYMLALSLGFAILLSPHVPADQIAVFLAYAPGGVTEMSLIALSLQMSPIIVAAHHMIRIIETVIITDRLGRKLLGI